MAASPNSMAATSDIEPASSPAPQEGKSFVSQAASDDEDAAGPDATPDPDEKPTRSKGKGSHKDSNGQHQIGKIRHLKKDDGEPLWRKDIQYDFLKAVFGNTQKVFTNSYNKDLKKQNFADLYIDTMSRSTKTSKVLRDKLLSDREAAKGMAMVCLLVNMGRMNTTLNFFPEMRAQLRTYHAIPSLQAHQDPRAYKQLQDAPRLKSILKGGMEDRSEPYTLESVKDLEVPRTNPVNLIFILCHSAQKVAELHFPRHHEFHDLVMKNQYSSLSRARAFLWLMWFYLESDYTEEGCEENPFGPGVDYDLDVANQGVPRMEEMTEEELAQENVDTDVEIKFGRAKQATRANILQMDQAYLTERETKRGKARVALPDDGPAILPRIRPSKHESDMDSTRSTPPPKALARSGIAGSGRRGAPLKYQIFEGSSPARQTPEGVVARKPRPPTAHQLAVERNRNQRVEYILERGLRRQQHKSRKIRRQDGSIFRSYSRLQAQVDPFEDSDGEAGAPRNLPIGTDKATGPFREQGLGGLCLLADEKDDFGEEVSSFAAALRRSTRRLARWNGREGELGVIPVVRKIKANGVLVNGKVDKETGDGPDIEVEDMSMLNPHGDANGDVTMDDIDIDDADQTAMADDEDRGDEDIDDADDADKTEIMGDSDMD